MSADVLAVIHNKILTCSKGQRRIGQYIIDHADQAAFLTAHALGKAVSVSESTVVRFASELGYSGYPELQEALRGLVKHRLQESPGAVKTAANGLSHPFELIEQAVDSADLDCGAEGLCGGSRLFVLTDREAEFLGIFLRERLQMAFDEVRLVCEERPKGLLERLVEIAPGDSVLAVTLSGDRLPTVGLDYCRSEGAEVVSLLPSPHRSLLTSVKTIDPVAALAILQGLTDRILEHKQDEIIDKTKKLQEIWDTYHVYEKNDQ